MSLHTVKHTFEELGKYQQQRIETILNVCYSPGCRATRLEPEEPSDLEIYDFTILMFNDIAYQNMRLDQRQWLRCIVQNIIDTAPYFKENIENEIFGR